ncbi:hypothetical protein P13BB106kb_p099 [Pectobacterium phage DU_PP_V]|uniref:Uncharacterized protein n=1 Tax=Pectobacterium phage DU_PP_V TaxID=2041492 RepID=A0A2D2W781_9CAUD|nr:hypothetical protein HOS40_gp070 [Pectobacterium phage DU_PP_V]ATS94083.1 hypothetical protein P13BB106kb_p099 [Pectobacterium phage DU_PP_V]
MLFFNYEKIYILSKGNPQLIVQCLSNLVSNPEANELLVGNSFIVNENVIINNPYNLSALELSEYLGILSFRNYSDYHTQKITSLDIQSVPLWIPKLVITTNKLIEINRDKLIFIEENIYG